MVLRGPHACRPTVGLLRLVGGLVGVYERLFCCRWLLRRSLASRDWVGSGADAALPKQPWSASGGEFGGRCQRVRKLRSGGGPDRGWCDQSSAVAPPVAAFEGCALGADAAVFWAAPGAPWEGAAGAAGASASSSKHLQLPQEAAFRPLLHTKPKVLMFITVTPIGSSANDVSAAANAYVDYLCGGGGAVSDTVDYYAVDGSIALDGAGQWSGGGADYLGLAGFVDRAHFSALLQGRHHETAERLISARGSAGRMHLKAGQPTRLVNGRPMWGIFDIAARLKMSAQDVTALVDPDSTMTSEEQRYLGRSELHKLLRQAGELSEAVTMEQLLASDAATIPTRDLAEAVGVTRRHIREVCRRIVAGEIEDSAGLRPEIVEREWRVDRLGAVRWSEQREAPAVRVGFDMTVTTEKSLSVFGLLGDEEVRRATVEVLAKANDEALRWLNKMASTGRSRGEKVHSHGLAVASFMHSTSRNDDPFLHVHNVVLNAIADEDGAGRALDATGLYAQAPAAAALATATMRRELTDRFGVDWRLSGRDTWEIAGIDDEVIDSFSTRRREIERAIGELYDEPVVGRLRAEISASTRGRKTELSVDELAERWHEIAESVGYGRDARAAVVGARPIASDDLGATDRSRLWRWLESPEGVAANSACFDTGDLYWSIANWAPGGTLRLLSPEGIVREAQQWLASKHVRMIGAETKVTANGRRIGHASEPMWTTGRILELQQQIAASWDTGRGCGRAVVDRSTVATAAQRSGVELSEEQLALVRSWTSSGDVVQAAIGRPGTGKTTTMAVVADVWERAGFAVKGAAVKGEAARLLAKEADVDTATVAAYLARYRLGNTPVDAKTVLIVDEASTLSEWDLSELIEMCVGAGAALRLIGDPAQHTSVQAGGSWAQMVERFATETPELQSQRRLKNTTEVEATEHVRAGEFNKAFAKLHELGHVQEFETWSEAYGPIIQRWWTLRQEGRPHPLVERTNANRQVLNTLAQTLRHRAGELGEIIPIGAKAFAVGDEVIAKEPSRDLRNADSNEHVRNGSTGTVVRIDADTVAVDFVDLGEISIPRQWAARPVGIDLAYAMTSYAVQGATNEASTSVVTDGTGAAELLVDITRGRDENVLIAVGRGDDEFSPENDDIATRVANSVRVEDLRTVQERDPAAVALHESGLAGLTLAEIAKVASEHPKHVTGRAVEQRVETLHLWIRHQTPDAVSALIGQRPDIEWQAARWEEVAGEIVVFNDRWPPGPRRANKRGLATLLTPTDQAGTSRRAKLVTEIETYRRSLTRNIEIGL